MLIRTKPRGVPSTTLPGTRFPPSAEGEPRHARCSDRRHPPHPDRSGLQGIPRPAAPRRDGRLRRRPAARAQPRPRSRSDRGCLLRGRHAAGAAGVQHRADRRPALREAAADGQRRHRLALLRVQPRRRAPRGERDQGRRGRRLPGRRRRVGEPLQRAHRGRRRGRQEREPARQGRSAGRLHRDGRDRGQRREEIRGEPGRHGQVRPALAGTGGALSAGRLLRPRNRPGDAARRDRGRQGRRAAPQLDPGGARRTSRGLRRRRRHRRQLLPAQRRRRGGAGDERHQGRGAGPRPCAPGSSPPRPSATSRSTWAWPRSGRSRRRSSGPG